MTQQEALRLTAKIEQERIRTFRKFGYTDEVIDSVLRSNPTSADHHDPTIGRPLRAAAKDEHVAGLLGVLNDRLVELGFEDAAAMLRRMAGKE